MSIIAAEIERERLLVRVYGIAVRAAQAILRGYTRVNETAEDYAHDFVIRLLKSEKAKELPTMKESELVDLIFSGVRNSRRNYYRQQNNHPVEGLNESPLAFDDTVAELERAERVQQVRDALGQLDPTDAAILMARFADGMTLREAEKQFDMCRGAIVRRSLAALASLRQVLAENGVEQPRQSDELLTLDEAVKLMQVGPRNIQKWVKRGRLERFSTGKTGYYSRRQLELIRVNRRNQRSNRFLTNTATR